MQLGTGWHLLCRKEITITLRVFARNLRRGRSCLRNIFSYFRFDAWPGIWIVALRLISQHTIYEIMVATEAFHTFDKYTVKAGNLLVKFIAKEYSSSRQIMASFLKRHMQYLEEIKRKKITNVASKINNLKFILLYHVLFP